MTQASPPPTRRDDVAEVIHGHVIVDPYRWLEDGSSPETIAWIHAQNQFTRSLLDAVPGRGSIAARLDQLLSIGDITVPEARKGRYFFLRRRGEQNQPVLIVRSGLEGAEQTLLDLNAVNPAGSTALDWWYPSADGRLIVAGLSEGGDEQSTLQVLEVDTGRFLADSIPNARAASVAWLPDGGGFYYTRYPRRGEVPPGEEAYHRHVFLHRLGTDPAMDVDVFGAGREAEDWPSVQLSPDGSYLLITVGRGWDRSDCYLRDEHAGPGPFVPVLEGEHALCSGKFADGRLYLHTNLDAGNFCLFEVDPANPSRQAWIPVVPERADAVLQDARISDGKLMLLYLTNASSSLEVRDLGGVKLRDIPLPAIGTVSSLSHEAGSPEIFFDFASFDIPPRIYRHDLRDSSTAEWARADGDVADGSYETRQAWYRSKDGTPISMFLVHKQGLVHDGSNPTVLTGYGGFDISMTPSFSRTLRFWLERGGVYALPNLRGGGEYGAPWHQAGMLANKQNVFDDVLAAADYLCSSKITRRDRLAISGGSNGGLLVGAAITQRPDTFRAAVCAVPLLDMLRYHLFQIARLWIAEYGSADDPEQFSWLAAYSPYQHVVDGTSYPATLLLTGDRDSRVDPLHARKMAARLQAASSSALPVLLRVELEAGHGAGRPRSKTLAEQTDIWTFLCWQLGVKP